MAKKGRGYSKRNYQNQRANVVKASGSEPTGSSDNVARKQEQYSDVSHSAVPEEKNGFEKFIEFCTSYGTWISFTVLLATAIGTFLNFQSDLKRAESDIKDNKESIDKNTALLNEQGKEHVSLSKDIGHLESDISDLENDVHRAESSLKSIEMKQVVISKKKEAANRVAGGI